MDIPSPQNYDSGARRYLEQTVPLAAQVPEVTQQRIERVAKELLADLQWVGEGIHFDFGDQLVIAWQIAVLVFARSDHKHWSITTVRVFADDRHARVAALEKSVHEICVGVGDVRATAFGNGSRANILIPQIIPHLAMGADRTAPLFKKNAFGESPWATLMSAELKRARKHLNAGRKSLFDTADVTSWQQYLVAASQRYFDEPELLNRIHRATFIILKNFYLIDITNELDWQEDIVLEEFASEEVSYTSIFPGPGQIFPFLFAAKGFEFPRPTMCGFDVPGAILTAWIFVSYLAMFPLAGADLQLHFESARSLFAGLGPVFSVSSDSVLSVSPLWDALLIPVAKFAGSWKNLLVALLNCAITISLLAQIKLMTLLFVPEARFAAIRTLQFCIFFTMLISGALLTEIPFGLLLAASGILWSAQGWLAGSVVMSLSVLVCPELAGLVLPVLLYQWRTSALQFPEFIVALFIVPCSWSALIYFSENGNLLAFEGFQHLQSGVYEVIPEYIISLQALVGEHTYYFYGTLATVAALNIFLFFKTNPPEDWTTLVSVDLVPYSLLLLLGSLFTFLIMPLVRPNVLIYGAVWAVPLLAGLFFRLGLSRNLPRMLSFLLLTPFFLVDTGYLILRFVTSQ